MDKLKLSIDDAINNLSTLADIELTRSLRIGLVEDNKIVVSDEDYLMESSLFLTIYNYSMILDVILESFSQVLKYLKVLSSTKDLDWNSDRTREGLQSLMEIVGDSQAKIDEYLRLLPLKDKNEYVEHNPIYQEIRHFYVNVIEKKFLTPLEGKEEWEKELASDEALINLETDHKAIIDFESLKQDKDYELFFLKDENDKPFFTPEMLRNVKLIEEFEEKEIPNVEDPLLEIRFLKDKDVQATAKQILTAIHFEIEAFYQDKISVYTHELANYLHKALLALMLSANPLNLIKASTHKNCIEYFADFQLLLHQALRSTEYQKILAFPECLQNPVNMSMHNLMLSLASALFYRKGGIKEEMIGFTLRLMRLGEEKETRIKPKKLSLEQELLEKDEKLRFLLSYFPSGPLSKNLDAVHLTEKESSFFSPILQENIPSYLFSIIQAEKNISLLRIPSPTYQRTIDQAKVLEEFHAFINDLKEKKKKHLLIDLQDRTSFKEQIRSHQLEEFAHRAMFHESLLYIAIDKNSSFYYQTAEYEDQNKYEDFKKVFIQQFKGEGFVLHPYMTTPDFTKFINHTMTWVHEVIFDGEKMLSRQERQDFIEIVYQCIILRLITAINPDSLSFTCKDALDTGAAQNSFFYLFLSLISEKELTQENKDFFFYLTYAPALLVRERGINSERLIRMVSALARFHASFMKNSKKILKELSSIGIQKIKLSF